MPVKPPAWIVRHRPSPSASLRLFCFPHAGAGASAFRPWLEDFDPTVEILAVQPPGREARFTESPYTRIDPLLDALEPAILPYLDRPFAFFGHSLGTLVSFELCRRLRAAGRPLPVHLFVSGRRAAQLPIREENFHTLSDADLIQELRRYQGTTEEILAHAELMELMLPMLRADFAVHETYEYAEGPPLPLPLSAFGGIDDLTVPEDRLDAWRHQTTGPFRRRMFPGNHFYLKESRRLLTQAIAEELREAGATVALPR